MFLQSNQNKNVTIIHVVCIHANVCKQELMCIIASFCPSSEDDDFQSTLVFLSIILVNVVSVEFLQRELLYLYDYVIQT